MANDALVDGKVIRGIDPSGNVRNVQVDASGNLTITASGGGDAVTIADGADVAEGATTNAAVVTDANGTVSGKLRGLVKIFADLWQTTNHALKTQLTPASTGTQSSVASSATDVTILAANANRLGATVFNDSTQILYLLLASGTSSATAHTVQLVAASYYEVPFGYTGALKGLWASANGSARVTELTA